MKFVPKIKFCRKNLLLALAAALSAAAHAADEPFVLPEVNVTATRDIKSQSAYAVDLQSGRGSGAHDSASMLEGAPGAAVTRNGSQTGIVQLRGLGGDRVNIQVDGMHITPACPNHMDPPMHYITADGMGALEVIAGIAPVSLGGDSIAGSVIANSAAATAWNCLAKWEPAIAAPTTAAPCCCARAQPMNETASPTPAKSKSAMT